MKNSKSNKSSYFKIDIISNAIDSLETCYDFLSKNDEFKWKWAALSIIHSLYMFCIANLEGGNYDNVLCFDDDEDNNRYVKIGNDEKWKKSRRIHRKDCDGYTIQWDYIEGEPSFPQTRKKLNDNDRYLIKFWTALARVQDKEIHIFFEPIILSDFQWKSINWLYKMVYEIIFFVPCHWSFFVEDFKQNIKNILPVIESVSMQSIVYLYGKDNKKKIKEIIGKIDELIEGKIDTNNSNANKTIVYSEGNNFLYLNKAKELLSKDLDILFYDGGNKNDLQKQFKRLIENKHFQKTIFLFDCDADTEFYDCNSKKTINIVPLKIPNNKNNKKVKNGIENLFSEILFKDNFYVPKTFVKPDGGVKIETKLNKPMFCDYICIERNNKEDFINFEKVFEQISKVL
jgi:hypothetical protein